MINIDMFSQIESKQYDYFTLRVISPKYSIERIWNGKDFTKDGKPKQCKYITKRMKERIKYYNYMGHKVVAMYTYEDTIA